MIKELNYKELKKWFDENEFGFKTTSEIQPCKNVIGQERAIEALEFALNVKNKGYNVFMCGVRGTGKTSFAIEYAKKAAAAEKTPNDMCYVYNFDNPKYPKLLYFEAGKGREFKEEFEDIIQILSLEIPKAYNDRDYEEQKESIVKDYQEKRDEIVKIMTEEAKQYGFGVKMTNSGMYFLPIVDGVTISEEDFESLSEEQKNEISAQSDIIQDKAAEIMRVIKDFEKQTKKEIDSIEYNIVLFTVGYYLSPLQDKYRDNDEVSKYLAKIKEDILDNIEDFVEDDSEEDEAAAVQMILPWISKKTTEESLNKYKVNLIVDNSELNGAPVIVDYNPTYSNLIGEVEYDSEYGNFITDYMKIKPGLLHKANGGYLILQASDLLSNPYAWETLRRVLKTGEIVIEPIKEYQLGAIAVASIRPEAAKCSVKVILVGSSYYYDILNEYDDEFLKLFKIAPMFDYEMKLTDENVKNVACFIKGFVAKENSLEFDVGAVRAVVEYSVRLAERKDRLSTCFSQINEILAEANAWAKMDHAEIISEKYVKKAVKKKISFAGLYEDKLTEMIMENDMLIETQGEAVGQINALTVIDMGTYSFGKPSRITASSYLGKSGIINIEKEAQMSGNIHDKGVQVIKGYLGGKYAQDFPLSLSCRICFEQSYSYIDGDSASSAEIYAVLSSLSGLPLRQDIAVTGSVNQKGVIQPIGGVIYKIEGFFDICSRRGLTGSQGVIIPVQNVKDLVLNDEVIDAVKEGLFHIYPVSSIDEGIEILTGVKAGTKSKTGKYSQNTVHGRVLKQLKSYYKKSSVEEE